VTQERRQDERRRRRLANQEQKRQGRPQRTDAPAGAVEFGGMMGWFQRNAKWFFLAIIILFVGGGIAGSFYSPSALPAETPTATPTTAAAATGSPTSTASPTRTPDPSIQRVFSAPPAFTLDPNKTYTAVIKMEKGGEVRLQLLPKDAPQAVNNFVFLAKNRFFDGLTFHRVLPGFMAQGGDPLGTGFGGPGYVLPPDKNSLPFEAGVISMAKGSAGVSGSQFFITLAPTPHLQGEFAVFGKVTAGMDVVQKITLRDPTKPNQPPSDVIASIQIIEGN
jgi:peptidylprolyl isomerase